MDDYPILVSSAAIWYIITVRRRRGKQRPWKRPGQTGSRRTKWRCGARSISLLFLWTTKVVLYIWTTKWEMGTTKQKIRTTNTLTKDLTDPLVCASWKIHEWPQRKRSCGATKLSPPYNPPKYYTIGAASCQYPFLWKFFQFFCKRFHCENKNNRFWVM